MRSLCIFMVSKVHLVTKQVADLVEPILDEMGFELVDVEYLSKYGRWVLRLYIDKEGGVTIDDCARVSGEIGDLIDVKDIIKHEYILEVSSPGLNRPLKKERDFIRATGKRVKVRMVTPVNGRRNFTGYLKNFEDGTLYVEAEGTLVALPWLEVDKANLVYEFNK
jgi:ribosome maturation factor RimP